MVDFDTKCKIKIKNLNVLECTTSKTGSKILIVKKMDRARTQKYRKSIMKFINFHLLAHIKQATAYPINPL